MGLIRFKITSFRRKQILPYLLVSPYLVFVSVFVIFPVVFCLFLTFHKWNIIAPMRFIGAENYARLIHDRLFWKAIGNTLKFLSLHIPLQLVVSLFLAQLLNQKIRAVSFFRASFYAGHCFRGSYYNPMAAIVWV
jgi:ABC-type sugar transport system permease subunit